MKIRNLAILLILIISVYNLSAQYSDANITGHILSEGEHLPFVNISVEGTTIGSLADASGHYLLNNLPINDSISIQAYVIGYKKQIKKIYPIEGETMILHFDLEKDALMLDASVITGDRNEVSRRDASVIVNTISNEKLKSTQSVNLFEGLNFCSGIRTENNCQNCGFTQVRMNGLEGPYSQLLINGNPLFSGLAGVYALELFPTNMIERLEIVRGGGSALYGSNAIAGTINLILKDPISNSYSLDYTSGFTGIGTNQNIAFDNTINVNTSITSSDNKSGMSLYATYKNKSPYDANGDGFTEIPKINSTIFGTRVFRKLSVKSKITADFFVINEERRGGNMLDYPSHEADISEELKHNITTLALNYTRFFRKVDILSIYASSQIVNRDSYYGALQSLNSYGETKGITSIVGGTYNAIFENSNLIGGLEYKNDILKDVKQGYPDYDNANLDSTNSFVIPHIDNVTIANQVSSTYSAFAQYDIKYKFVKLTTGLRFDYYNISDNTDINNSEDVEGKVISPRINLLFNLHKNIELRLNYSKGFRAPQIFDEDLHIESSGSRQVLHRNDPNLTQESSNSFMSSINYHNSINKMEIEILIEGFYTILNNPFVNEYGVPDANGTVYYTRTNAEAGAFVRGINSEVKIIPNNKLAFLLGYTIQQSEYEEAQEFDQKAFLRTPNQYGFINFEWKLSKKFIVDINGTYTGKMYVPYFGVSIANPDEGELRESENFFDMGTKLRYTFTLKNKNKLELYAGMKNILNSYQNDFDYGVNRDPAYIYGPALPRYAYFGFNISM